MGEKEKVLGSGGGAVHQIIFNLLVRKGVKVAMAQKAKPQFLSRLFGAHEDHLSGQALRRANGDLLFQNLGKAKAKEKVAKVRRARPRIWPLRWATRRTWVTIVLVMIIIS